MRVLLLIVLIALIPLRGFASVGMQTGMGTAALHQAMAVVDAATESSEAASSSEPAGSCCGQCSVCDLCHLLLGQTPASLFAVAMLGPPLPAVGAFRFASADRRAAHKPPPSRL